MPLSAPAPAIIRPTTDALITVDMQNDFLVDGAPLRVPGGLALVGAINAVSRQFTFRYQVATQDWHPVDHCSFKQQGGPWPPHCIRGTPGADLHADLHADNFQSILRKGTKQAADSYSAFADDTKEPTGLAGLLHSLGVTRVFVVGVAYDYCVFFTAMDGRRLGFDVVVVSDLCAAVDEATAKARTVALQEAGVVVLESSALVMGQ
ncbi:nicotinamidase (PNC1) [Leptomonas seymouri]|uniref:nicotinamidase n=1 Tax=Leptomonas seymouri TaxID=5684 RepID=A0A0N0P300_LEPSE|nr:nicotinamidase (PNC1) [Leptomonas seymouri]|eukprot:KPI83077.1 nicotinamidase (PNC1) [Leptomonas seymouri]